MSVARGGTRDEQRTTGGIEISTLLTGLRRVYSSLLARRSFWVYSPLATSNALPELTVHTLRLYLTSFASISSPTVLQMNAAAKDIVQYYPALVVCSFSPVLKQPSEKIMRQKPWKGSGFPRPLSSRLVSDAFYRLTAQDH
jgi:hypothetical protein